VVGDRGMVTQENLWLEAIDETKWIDCPAGISSAEKSAPPRTRVQEVPSRNEGMQVFVIDSNERREYGQSMRSRSMRSRE
jgi:hypothetical protein